MTLFRLTRDKGNHWAYGSVIAAASALIALGVLFILAVPLLWAVPAAAAALVAVAFGWEKWQEMKGSGFPSSDDAWNTVAGGLMVLLPLALALWLTSTP